MRREDKVVLWPVYFDSTKTRAEGRRVAKNLAVQSPKLEEIKKAVERTNLEPEVVNDSGHPSAPWIKTGLIRVRKSGSKTEMILKVAEMLRNLRK